MRDLSAIKGRLAAVTPWPWEFAADGSWQVVDHEGQAVCRFDLSRERRLRNAEFIANAPEDMQILLEVIGDLRTSRDAVQEADYETATDGWLGAMATIRAAAREIAAGNEARAYLLLGRAILADEGVIKWTEVGR